MGVVHRPPFCGTWYPEDRGELGGLLDEVYERTAKRTAQFARDAVAVVVPHAAPVYSGAVAAAAYRCLEQRAVSRVVLLGFCHRRRHRAVGIPDVDAYSTPFGEAPLDARTIRSLGNGGLFRTMPEAELCDHSVEVQLPFLKRSLPDASLLPLYVGELSEGERREAARTLAELVDERTALIASSDFTHYGAQFRFTPFPADSYLGERLREMDGRVIAGAGSLDPAMFHRELEMTRSNTCGRGPIALLAETLRMTRGCEIFQETLDYETSAEITGDRDHSVSYAALGYFRASSYLLEERDQQALVAAAHGMLDSLVHEGRPKAARATGGTPAIERRAGVFVTILQNGELRGCVGSVDSRHALRDAVGQLTLAAATEDPRFDPIRRGETGFTVSLSVLTPAKRVTSTDSVIAGEHGVVFDSSRHRGVLLPQVAQRHGWDRGQFLDALAVKAGAPRSALDDPLARLSVFRVQVFGDH
jgi:AmmeMemoRadiSam system protein B/AmmeMemoRadiSam system protein A